MMIGVIIFVIGGVIQTAAFHSLGQMVSFSLARCTCTLRVLQR